MLIFQTPVLYLAFGWFVYASGSLLRATLISCFALILAFKKIGPKLAVEDLLLISIPLILFISSLVNQSNLYSAFLGGFDRNFGLGLYVSLIFIYLVVKKVHFIKINNFIKSLYFINILIIVYGLIQVTNHDLIKWQLKYKGIPLTLGNPNFAGALIGIMSTLAIYGVWQEKSKKRKIYQFVTYLILFYLAFKTDSLQSVLLIILCSSLFILIAYREKLEARNKWKFTKKILGLGIVPAIIILSLIFKGTTKQIFKHFYYDGSVGHRLDFWKTGFNMFLHHPLFGVGTGNYFKYSSLYRSPGQALSDGAFIYPDRSHNVFIDLLAEGGVFAGIAWLAIVIFSIYAIIRLNRIKELENRSAIALLSAIWLGYLIQSFISPDHVLLTFIGFVSLAFLLQQYRENFEIKLNKYSLKVKTGYLRTATVILLIISTLIYTKALLGDARLNKVLKTKAVSSLEIRNVLESVTDPREVALLESETVPLENGCTYIEHFGSSYTRLGYTPPNHYYLAAICLNSAGNFKEAVRNINEAIKKDPLNPVLLVDRVKLDIAAGFKSSANRDLAELKSKFPANVEIAKLQSSVVMMK